MIDDYVEHCPDCLNGIVIFKFDDAIPCQESAGACDNCHRHHTKKIEMFEEEGAFKQKEYDPINSPHHYKDREHEAIDIIEEYGFNFNLGNVIKYVLRSGKKDNRIEDLKKAEYYIKREIKNDTRS